MRTFARGILIQKLTLAHCVVILTCPGCRGRSDAVRRVLLSETARGPPGVGCHVSGCFSFCTFHLRRRASVFGLKHMPSGLMSSTWTCCSQILVSEDYAMLQIRVIWHSLVATKGASQGLSPFGMGSSSAASLVARCQFSFGVNRCFPKQKPAQLNVRMDQRTACI